MKKADLKSGMVVELRDGTRMLIININGLLSFIGTDDFERMRCIGNDLSNTKNYQEFDIIKIYQPTTEGRLNKLLNTGILIWERTEELPEHTMEELAIKLGYNFKTIKK